MGKWIFVGIVLLVVLVIALPRFGESMGWGLTRMEATNKALTPSEADITAGQSVYFQNTGGQDGLVICLGRNGVCQATPNGPGELQPRGLALHANETHGVQFDHPGSYAITSPQLHANARVVVAEASDSGGGGDGSGGSGGSSGSNNSAGGSSGGDDNGGFGGNGGSNSGSGDDDDGGSGGSSGGSGAGGDE